MSDTPLGPGWWQASDGRWYPPPSPYAQPPPPTPQPPTPPTPPTPPPSRSKAPLVIGLVALAALLGAVAVILVLRSGDDEPEAQVEVTVTAGREDTSTTAEAGGELDIDVPDGFESVVDEEEGFAIALPDTWTEFDLDDPGLQEALDEFAESNPDFAAVLEQAQSVAQSGGVLFALDATDVDFASNLNIIKGPGELDPGFLEPIAIGQLESIGAGNIEAEIVDLPAGGALRVDYDLALNTADGGTTAVHGVQHAVPAAGSTWTITLTTADIEDDRSAVEAIMESFTATG